MRLIALFVLVSCARPAVVAPSSPQNDAVRFARTIATTAACVPIVTDAALPANAKPGELPPPDAAVCDFGRLLAYCWSGEGAGSDCVGFADMRPKPPAAAPPKDEKPPAPVETAKKPDEKPKAEPPKPEAKKK
jgi:outer membrane biosynthesis protein TonB